jgi:hypothetical protein
MYLVRVMHRVRGILRTTGILDTLGPEHMWHSISQGVRAARHAAGVLGPVEVDHPELGIEEHIAASDDPVEDGDGD